MKMTPEQLATYKSLPFPKSDRYVRDLFSIPENRYYVVGLFPEHAAGVVEIQRERVRPVAKISKSDQP